MTAPGPLALLGGGEHREPCRPVDRWLLERTGVARPRVVVVPAASLPGTRPATIALARTWWASLGARATAVAPEDVTAAVDAVAAADVVVLTGGVPAALVRRLGASPVWDAIVERWRAGAALSGSSAGAMAMMAWRLRLVPPSPFGLTPGLGPLEGYVVVPHFDRLVARSSVMRRVAVRRQRSYDGLAVLGIDEGTGVVSHGGEHLVLGAGAATTIDADGWHQHPSGSATPALLGPPALAGPLTPVRAA
ncbi:Type 1 glutamine amidotransferase-like domain-containing protein [Euzebya sp.]|uniref:Type 1 glutamine amidotransferase-like domain-containing protein n=1 Tax=Euzebya sp. TaxID=1971409 RepID=UPI0035173D7C